MFISASCMVIVALNFVDISAVLLSWDQYVILYKWREFLFRKGKCSLNFESNVSVLQLVNKEIAEIQLAIHKILTDRKKINKHFHFTEYIFKIG